MEAQTTNKPCPNPKGHNQWTKRRNTPGDQEKLEKWRERYKAHGIIQTLHDHGQGKIKLEATQIKALEIVLDRLEPRLSSIEQTVIEPPKDERALLLELREAIEADPAFRSQLQALLEGRPVDLGAEQAQSAPNPLKTGTSE